MGAACRENNFAFTTHLAAVAAAAATRDAVIGLQRLNWINERIRNSRVPEPRRKGAKKESLRKTSTRSLLQHPRYP